MSAGLVARGRRALTALLTTAAATVGLAAAAIAPLAGAQPAPPPADRPVERTDENSRLAHADLLEKTRQGRIDLYFAGDSITRRWGATDYPELLAHWRETFHGWNAANFAWGGDTTRAILWRLENGELDGLSPKAIVLLAGTNNVGEVLRFGNNADDDAGRNIATAAADIAQGVEAIVRTMRAKAPDAAIVLMAVFPRNDDPRALELIAGINERLAPFADRAELIWVDINDRLADASGRLRDDVSDDGLHLNLDGYRIWSDALRPVLTEILGPPADEDHAPPPTGNPAAEGRVR